MSKKEYDWKNGAEIKDHTRKKHSIWERYLRKYLTIRCQIPQQEVFRLVLVDAFAGAGRYSDESPGSPLILVDVLRTATNEVNALRVGQSLRPVRVECLLLLNDKNRHAIDQLKQHIAPALRHAHESAPELKIRQEFYTQTFEDLYPKLVKRINKARCRNVIVFLDQYGYSEVTSGVISDITQRWRSAEVFLTFAIGSLLAFLSPQKDGEIVPFDGQLSTSLAELVEDEDLLNKKEWLGEAEKIVFEHLRTCAPYVSPFSINNPKGWRYWLMHFANSHRARQAYNNLLHEDDSVQAHYGRAGLRMLSYDPREKMQLYLFDKESRSRAQQELMEEIPNLIAESGNILPVSDFYASAYSATPAHTDDIHSAIMDNPDIDVITESGGTRRKANTIKTTDTLRLKRQTSLFLSFFSEIRARPN